MKTFISMSTNCCLGLVVKIKISISGVFTLIASKLCSSVNLFCYCLYFYSYFINKTTTSIYIIYFKLNIYRMRFKDSYEFCIINNLCMLCWIKFNRFFIAYLNLSIIKNIAIIIISRSFYCAAWTIIKCNIAFLGIVRNYLITSKCLYF